MVKVAIKGWWGIMWSVPKKKKKGFNEWEGSAQKEGFKSGMKERVGDGKLIIISINVSGISEGVSTAKPQRNVVVDVESVAVVEIGLSM